MTVLAENKRRTLAAVIALLVVLAIGYGIGRVGHGTSQAQAAPTRVATRTVTEPGVTRTTSSTTAARLRRQLANTRRTGVRLRRSDKAGQRAEVRLRRARRCGRDRHVARRARGMTAAVH